MSRRDKATGTESLEVVNSGAEDWIAEEGGGVSDREAAIREALDLGLQVWRNTGVRDKFLRATDSLTSLLAELAAARERLVVWESLCMTPGQVEELREREAKLREALRQIRDYDWHPGDPPAPDVRGIARAALADGEGET